MILDENPVRPIISNDEIRIGIGHVDVYQVASEELGCSRAVCYRLVRISKGIQPTDRIAANTVARDGDSLFIKTWRLQFDSIVVDDLDFVLRAIRQTINHIAGIRMVANQVTIFKIVILDRNRIAQYVDITATELGAEMNGIGISHNDRILPAVLKPALVRASKGNISAII